MVVSLWGTEEAWACGEEGLEAQPGLGLEQVEIAQRGSNLFFLPEAQLIL